MENTRYIVIKNPRYIVDTNIVDLHAKLNEKDLLLCRSLVLAVQEGKFDTVEDLIKKGVNVNFRNRFGHTLLMSAAEKGYTKIAELLQVSEKTILETA
jgi:ankyrin repeat protein